MKWADIFRRNADSWVLAACICCKMLLQYLLIHPSYDLHRDEYLHLDQAKHLDWGFISLPPFSSWVARLILLLGNDAFLVKFFPALFGALTIYFAWKIVDELGGKLFAKLIVAIAILCSGILRLNILFQPNSFEVLSWTAAHFFLIRYVKSAKPANLYLLATVLALSFLNKYNVIFFIAGLVPALLIFPERRMLFSKHLVLAMLLFLLLVSPNLYWQFSNGIPFIWHMKELARTQLVNMSRTGFLKEQILFFLNSIFVLVIAFIGFARYPTFRPYRYIPVSWLFTILLYVYFRAKGYYSVGLYPVLLAFGAIYFVVLTEKKFWLRALGLAFILVVFFPVIKYAFPSRPAEQIVADRASYQDLGLNTWEDGKVHDLPQDFADMLGWRELAYKTDSAFLLLKGGVLVLTNNYGQAGAINYYSVNGIEAVSFNADYLNWFPRVEQIKHVIRVMEVEDDDDDPNRNEERSLCDSLILAGEITNPLAREKGTRIWVMKNVKPEVWPRILGEVDRRKKHE